MTLLGSWQARLKSQTQVQSWGVLAILGLLLVGFLLYGGLVLLPEVQQRRALRLELEAAESQLSAAQTARAEGPAKMQARLDEAQTRLSAAAQAFLTEDAATAALTRLYARADTTGVEIVNLSAVGASTADTYVRRDFRVQVTGSLESLLDFLGNLDEVALSGYFVDGVAIAATEDSYQLDMAVSLYTSPFAEPEDGPASQEQLAEVQHSQIQARLETTWSERDWQGAVRLLEGVVTADPENVAARTALYRAYMNLGYQLLAKRSVEAAKIQFEMALGINPQGEEGHAELEQLAADATLAFAVQEQLRQELTGAKAAGDWPNVIRLLRLVEAVDHDYGPVSEDLYLAYVNYANQLAVQGNSTAAVEQYELARTLHPERELPPLPEIVPTTVPTTTQVGAAAPAASQGS